MMKIPEPYYKFNFIIWKGFLLTNKAQAIFIKYCFLCLWEQLFVAYSHMVVKTINYEFMHINK